MNDIGDEEPDLPIPRGMVAYLRTRLQLALIETEEALSHLKGKLGPVAVILISAVVSYFLILTALVSWLGKLLGLISESPIFGWELAALLIAGLHLALILAMRKKIVGGPATPLFEYSRAELERDREWLQENKPTNKNSLGS